MSPSSRRAWIEILWDTCVCSPRQTSPSSRRAWIEISTHSSPSAVMFVALLAEGVDRNNRSLSDDEASLVALLAEGVDRNYLVIDRNAKGQRRPPRGGRG